MKYISLVFAFLLTILVTSQKLDAIFSSKRKMEDKDSIEFLDQQLRQIFDMYVQKINKTKTNLIGKRILLKNLIIILLRKRQRTIDETPEKTTRKTGSGYMHWRTG